MVLHAYTLHDLKALTFSPPFFAVADGAAVRMVSDTAADTNTTIGRHPADYVLYRIGAYDDGTGELLPVSPRVHVVDVVTLVRVHPELPWTEPSQEVRGPNKVK